MAGLDESRVIQTSNVDQTDLTGIHRVDPEQKVIPMAYDHPRAAVPRSRLILGAAMAVLLAATVYTEYRDNADDDLTVDHCYAVYDAIGPIDIHDPSFTTDPADPIVAQRALTALYEAAAASPDGRLKTATEDYVAAYEMSEVADTGGGPDLESMRAARVVINDVCNQLVQEDAEEQFMGSGAT
jgi:hypothetical protein